MVNLKDYLTGLVLEDLGSDFGRNGEVIVRVAQEYFGMTHATRHWKKDAELAYHTAKANVLDFRTIVEREGA